MGILSKAKEMLGGEQSEEDLGFDDEFEEGYDEEFDESEEDDEIEEEPEWDTAYQFSKDISENMGFSGVDEFLNKAMIYRIEKSPMYRDRIQSGIRTINSITSSFKEIENIRGEMGGEEKDLRSYADELKAANDVMDEIDRLGGREEELLNEVLSIGRDFVDGMNQRSSGGVDTSMGVKEE